MVTLQHTLCYLLTNNGDMNRFKKGIAYCLLPDGIRGYIGPRAYSHYEENTEKNDVSWYKYPSDLKTLTKEKANLQDMYLAHSAKTSCLGENSHVDKFVEINKHLDEDYYNGVLIHLIQDYVFDEWVRKKIDCSNRYEPNEVFFFQGKAYKGKEIRNVIAEIELYGFYYLSYLVYELYGIVANQEWFDENVFKVLKEKYPEDLAKSTYNYMKIPERLNDKITKQDWRYLNFRKYNQEYRDLYDQVIVYSIDTDSFFKDNFDIYNTNKKNAA